MNLELFSSQSVFHHLRVDLHTSYLSQTGFIPTRSVWDPEKIISSEIHWRLTSFNWFHRLQQPTWRYSQLTLRCAGSLRKTSCQERINQTFSIDTWLQHARTLNKYAKAAEASICTYFFASNHFRYYKAIQSPSTIAPEKPDQTPPMVLGLRLKKQGTFLLTTNLQKSETQKTGEIFAKMLWTFTKSLIWGPLHWHTSVGLLLVSLHTSTSP